LKDDLIDNTKILDTNKFSVDILKNLFSNTNKGKGEVANKEIEKIKKIVQKIMEEPNDDNFFSFTDFEESQLEESARNANNGVITIDVGCSTEEIKFSDQSICDTASLMDGSKRGTQEFRNKVFETVENENDLPTDTNKEKANRSILDRLLQAVKLTLILVIVKNPIVKLIFLILSIIKGTSNADKLSLTEQIKLLLPFILCIIDKIKALFVKFIYNFVKRLILNLIKGLIILIAKEKIQLFINQLRSLVPFGV